MDLLLMWDICNRNLLPSLMTFYLLYNIDLCFTHVYLHHRHYCMHQIYLLHINVKHFYTVIILIDYCVTFLSARYNVVICLLAAM